MQSVSTARARDTTQSFSKNASECSYLRKISNIDQILHGFVLK